MFRKNWLCRAGKYQAASLRKTHNSVDIESLAKIVFEMTEKINPWFAVPKILIGRDIEERLVWRDAVAELRRGLSSDFLYLTIEQKEKAEGEVDLRVGGVEDIGVGGMFSIRAKDPASGRMRTSFPDYRLFSSTSEKYVHDASIDGEVVTMWRAVAVSLIATSHLAKFPPARIAVIGAGRLAQKVIEGYCAYFTTLREVTVWSRRPREGEALCARVCAAGKCGRAKVRYEAAMATACRDAEVIITTTSAEAPVLTPSVVRPGAHVDLIGANRAEAREADVRLIKRSALYVDDRRSALKDSGEFSFPLSQNVISESEIVGDLKAIVAPAFRRQKCKANTLFKQGGAPQHDVIMARYIYARAIESEVYLSMQPSEMSHMFPERVSEFPNPAGRVLVRPIDVRGTFDQLENVMAEDNAQEAMRMGKRRNM